LAVSNALPLRMHALIPVTQFPVGGSLLAIWRAAAVVSLYAVWLVFGLWLTPDVSPAATYLEKTPK